MARLLQLRDGTAFALARDGGPFHILREGSFPSESLCGQRLGALVTDLSITDDVCGNCCMIVSLEAAADDLNQRVATAHERVACPRCGAEIGEQCRRMVGGVGLKTKHNKHSHRPRLRAAGISLR